MKLSDVVLGGGAIIRGDIRRQSVEIVQLALRKAGHEIIADGEFGEKTEDAVRAFQAARGIAPSGRVGLSTADALDSVAYTAAGSLSPRPLPSVKDKAPWLSTARALTGTKELPGAADSPIIMSWNGVIASKFPDLAAYAKTYTHDSIPWCAQFEAYCMAVNGIKPVTKADGAQFGYLWADDWKHFGGRLDRPIVGCILVLTRNGGGHVTTMEGETATHYIGRGGNQSDMVKVSLFPKNRLTAAVWPKEYAIATIAGMTSADLSPSVKEV